MYQKTYRQDSAQYVIPIYIICIRRQKVSNQFISEQWVDVLVESWSDM